MCDTCKLNFPKITRVFSLVHERITEDQNSLCLEKLQCPHLEFRNRVDKVDCYLGNGIFHGAVVRCVYAAHLPKIT